MMPRSIGKSWVDGGPPWDLHTSAHASNDHSSTPDPKADNIQHYHPSWEMETSSPTIDGNTANKNERVASFDSVTQSFKRLFTQESSTSAAQCVAYEDISSKLEHLGEKLNTATGTLKSLEIRLAWQAGQIGELQERAAKQEGEGEQLNELMQDVMHWITMAQTHGAVPVPATLLQRWKSLQEKTHVIA